MTRPRALDLFSGAGGAAVGLYRAGFEVVGVDIEAQPNYPFEFRQADATCYPLEGFDLVWMSCPCQGYSALNNANKREYPRLIGQMRDRVQAWGGPYIIENVVGSPLISPVMLCGSMFGLKVIRHRLFESNLLLFGQPHKCHNLPKGRRISDHDKESVWRVWGHEVGTAADWSRAMGITWMRTKRELAQAIPPAYSEFLGRQVMAYIQAGSAA